MTDWNQLSILETAETLLKQNDKPMTFLELFQAIGELKGLSDEEKSEIISQVYADFIVSAKFVYVGDDLWDLKGRQSIDLWDKDGAYYGETYEAAEDEEEESEEEYDEEEDEDEESEEESEEDEESEEEPYEKEPDFDEYEEDIDYDGFEDEEEEFVEDEDDVTHEEEEDFDSDKYNEYMDDYEKMYDK